MKNSGKTGGFTTEAQGHGEDLFAAKNAKGANIRGVDVARMKQSVIRFIFHRRGAEYAEYYFTTESQGHGEILFCCLKT